MEKKLAIKGHLSRGKEVIELFKMMGGCECGFCGGGTGFYYYISQFGNIEASCKPTNFDTYIVYTLEEFWEKYPYKVGDIIKFPNNMAEEIAEMKWDEELEDIIYTSVSGCTRPCHVPKNKEEKKINQMSLANCDLDEVEIVLGDKFELKIEDGKYYAVRKKSKYPTTYDECCKILGCKANHFFTDFSYNGLDIEISNYEDKINDLLRNFRKLRYCRDAYWKIAGEEMGLGKPWEPDWNDGDNKFVIQYLNNEVGFWLSRGLNYILAFPTVELRDAFYENFKDLIEQCKELL